MAGDRIEQQRSHLSGRQMGACFVLLAMNAASQVRAYV
jgi:hypothetical protein